MRSSPLRCIEQQQQMRAWLSSTYDLLTSDVGVVWDLHNEHRACMQQWHRFSCAHALQTQAWHASAVPDARTIQRLQIQQLHPLPCPKLLLRDACIALFSSQFAQHMLQS
jgi:hypothetical protein